MFCDLLLLVKAREGAFPSAPRSAPAPDAPRALPLPGRAAAKVPRTPRPPIGAKRQAAGGTSEVGPGVTARTGQENYK